MDSGDRLLYRVARQSGWWGVGLAAAGLVSTVAAAGLPALIGSAVDAALDGGSGTLIVVLLVVALGAASAMEMADEYLTARVATTASGRMRHGIVRQVLHLGLAGQRRFEPGDLIGRMLQSTGEVSVVAPTLIHMASGVLTGIVGIVALFVIDWRLPLVLLAGMPATLLIGRVFMRRTTELSTEYQEVHGQLASRFVDAVGGARTIRASGTLEQETRRVLEPLAEIRASGLRMWEARRQLNWQVSVMMPALQVAVLATAGIGVAQGRVSPGNVMAAMGYLGLAMGLFRQAMAVAELGRLRGGARRVLEVVETDDEPSTGTRPVPSGSGKLELRDITVVLEDTTLIDGLNLDVPAGSTVAIVGTSGTGKSTLATVAGGLIAPDGGKVLLDGVPIRELAPEDLRALVSYAFETPNLLGERVIDAISYGNADAEPDDVMRASRNARAHDFVERLPEKYETTLEDLRLSGGERQRLGLARAAARRARLVILDDAMSSLDTATKREVAGALEDALAGATKLVVAHRASSAARADLVAWLEGGRIRALAPHETLWDDPAYRRLFGADAQDDGEAVVPVWQEA